tara:strand:- start:77 stop:796 length:720 start_codon:yes stop_codon:yes gene_type:complete
MKYLFRLLVIFAFVSNSMSLNAATISIYASHATTLYSAWDDDYGYIGNYASGRNNTLDVYYESYYTADGLLGFDLTSLYSLLGGGDSMMINSVSLTIGETSDSYGGNPFWVMGTTYDNWDEASITYDDFYAAAPFGSLLNMASSYFLSTIDGYQPAVALDLDPGIQTSYYDDGYLSLLIAAGDWTFTSPSEMYGVDSAYEPLLEIDYTITSTVPAPGSLLTLLFGLITLIAVKNQSRQH